MKKVFLCCALILILISGFVALSTDFDKINALPDKAYVSINDIKDLNAQKAFGYPIRITISDITASNQKKQKAKMWVKLFGFIPIKQIEVELSEGERVYLGGIPLGFEIQTKGLLVVGSNSLSQEDLNPATTQLIQNGDFLLAINNYDLHTPDDAIEILNNIDSGSELSLKILRNNQEITSNVTLKKDTVNGDNKLGLWVKNSANGVGTLTFIRMDNRFGALGHAITDYDTGVEIPVSTGKIYKCNQIGITKAEKNTPGELKCIFLQGINTKGTIEKNTHFGVFGNVSDVPSLIDYNRTAEIGSRLTIKHGKAKILSSVSGVLEEYDIDIIKTYYQPQIHDKSFIFRVTDKRLLELTGGILQGMSGSPIIQDGKLIGATTHVFVSDPTKGYGIYADWMAEE